MTRREDTQTALVPCPVPGCGRLKKPVHVMCSACWYRLPPGVRAEIWRLYRAHPGSARHREAVHNAILMAEQLRLAAEDEPAPQSPEER